MFLQDENGQKQNQGHPEKRSTSYICAMTSPEPTDKTWINGDGIKDISLEYGKSRKDCQYVTIKMHSRKLCDVRIYTQILFMILTKLKLIRKTGFGTE